jgi:hypothetical protein
VPHLLLLKVVKGKKYVPAPFPDFQWHFPDNSNKYVEKIKELTSQMLTYRALYELQYKKPQLAKIYVRKLVALFPDFTLPDELNKIRD